MCNCTLEWICVKIQMWISRWMSFIVGCCWFTLCRVFLLSPILIPLSSSPLLTRLRSLPPVTALLHHPSFLSSTTSSLPPTIDHPLHQSLPHSIIHLFFSVLFLSAFPSGSQGCYGQGPSWMSCHELSSHPYWALAATKGANWSNFGVAQGYYSWHVAQFCPGEPGFKPATFQSLVHQHYPLSYSQPHFFFNLLLFPPSPLRHIFSLFLHLLSCRVALLMFAGFSPPSLKLSTLPFSASSPNSTLSTLHLFTRLPSKRPLPFSLLYHHFPSLKCKQR